jgi:DNA polymerase-1
MPNLPNEIKLPNVRKLFLPRPGHVMLDCDLSGADAQVVAWEAQDDDLKRAFKSGLNIHNHNGKTIWGDLYTVDGKRPGAKYTMRDECKRAVHATNYGTSARTLASTLGWKISEAEAFITRWLQQLHRPIGTWHERVHFELNSTRTIRNAFGYRITYFDRTDALLPTALAWGPQSTVGLVCAKGGIRLRSLPWVSLLLQVHDSLVFEIPTHRFTPSNLATIKDHLEVEVPYPNDPLLIPWEVAASAASWGDCQKIKWSMEDVQLSKQPVQKVEA